MNWEVAMMKDGKEKQRKQLKFSLHHWITAIAAPVAYSSMYRNLSSASRAQLL